MGGRSVVGVSLAACALAGGLTGCATAPTTGIVRVVAAENVWGNIAAQLGGDRVSVTSIISSPGTDPHDYEPRARDARAVAMARYVIVNGAGYDPWASKLVAADGDKGQRRLDVGDLVGVKDGGNPHRWYAPDDVAPSSTASPPTTRGCRRPTPPTSTSGAPPSWPTGSAGTAPWSPTSAPGSRARRWARPRAWSPRWPTPSGSTC